MDFNYEIEFFLYNLFSSQIKLQVTQIVQKKKSSKDREKFPNDHFIVTLHFLWHT